LATVNVTAFDFDRSVDSRSVDSVERSVVVIRSILGSMKTMTSSWFLCGLQ